MVFCIKDVIQRENFPFELDLIGQLELTNRMVYLVMMNPVT